MMITGIKEKGAYVVPVVYVSIAGTEYELISDEVN